MNNIKNRIDRILRQEANSYGGKTGSRWLKFLHRTGTGSEKINQKELIEEYKLKLLNDIDKIMAELQEVINISTTNSTLDSNNIVFTEDISTDRILSENENMLSPIDILSDIVTESILSSDTENDVGILGGIINLENLKTTQANKKEIKEGIKILKTRLATFQKDPQRVSAGKKNSWVLWVKKYKKDHPDVKITRDKMKELSVIYKTSPEFLEKQEKQLLKKLEKLESKNSG